MPKHSAGILPYRIKNNILQVYLAHPGGPFFAQKDDGYWSIVKGEIEPGETPVQTATREFPEETGHAPPDGTLVDLGEVTYASYDGKIVRCYAVETDQELLPIRSNMITIKWPPRTDHQLEIPEMDRADWFDAAAARLKIYRYQLPFIDRLLERTSAAEGESIAAGDQATLL
jgi:predicted NUDIX family NTP pyrophosphohydrolase